MAAIMLQSIPSFYTKVPEKSLFNSANTYEKYFVCKDYCIAHHDDKTCFLPAFMYHIILFGNVEELIKNLDTFCFTYQHLDCLYTLFKYRISGKVIAKSGQVFDNVQGTVDFNHRNKVGKAEAPAEKVQKAFIELLQKTKSTQTSGLVFAERVEKVERTKVELDLMKFVKNYHGF